MKLLAERHVQRQGKMRSRKWQIIMSGLLQPNGRWRYLLDLKQAGRSGLAANAIWRFDTGIKQNWKFEKFENSTRRRETAGARVRPPPAESGETSKAGDVEQTPHRIMDLISN